MKNSFRIGLFSMVFTLAACHSVGNDALFRLTLHAVDDEGRPVQGAIAQVAADRRPKDGESAGKGVFVEGETDQNGYFSGEVEAWNAKQAGYRLAKAGYYNVWSTYRAKAPVRGKWQPWNPTIEVLLKRVKNPVPMYAKWLSADIPVSGIDVGYDLVVGDWVAPFGKGKTSDMLFHSEGEVQGDRDYHGTLKVTFPGQGNGLISFEAPQPQSSPLRLPYEAPTDAYQSSWAWRSVRRYNTQEMKNEEYIDDSSKTRNFFIRVRTESDAEGKIVRAMYGKIHAPFVFDARGSDPWGRTKKQYVAFTYYLNPDGTRNVEYDPKRNLLKSPKPYDPDYENLAP